MEIIPSNGPGTEKPIQRMFFEVADPYFRHVRMPLTCDGLMSVFGRRKKKRYGKLSGQGNAGSDMDGAAPEKHQTLVVSVACGLAHTICLSSDRMLWSWGDNSHGQLGLGHRNTCPLPRLARILLPFSRNSKRQKEKGNPTGRKRKPRT